MKGLDSAGVRHIAFTPNDIVRAVGAFNSRDVEFLDPPDTYCDLLGGGLELAAHDERELRELNILVDSLSTNPQSTFLFEVIVRLGTCTFGSGNISALYEAVEAERVKPRGSSR